MMREIENLKDELDKVRRTPPAGTEDLAKGKEVFELRYYTNADIKGSHWKTMQVTWDTICYYVLPFILTPCSVDGFIQGLEMMVNTHTTYPGRVHKIDEDDSQTIAMHLTALGVVVTNGAPGDDEWIETTLYGKALISKLRSVKKGEKTSRSDLLGEDKEPYDSEVHKPEEPPF